MEKFRSSWSVPGAFGTGIDVLADGDLLMAGRLVGERRVISDSAVHRFTPDGQRVRAYFVPPEPVQFGESSMNAMKAIVVDSTIIGLQHTTNVAVLHDLSSGAERADSLGGSFYRPLAWTLEPPSPPDAVIQEWFRDQIMAWWLRDLDEGVYAAGFRVWLDSLDDWRTRWVFATPKTGPFVESELTDAHPAFIHDGRLYSVRIRPDGRTELIVGEAPPLPDRE
ncbi:MAG: hypothetical protein ACREM1_06795 [Longimicrobiales bacterium]